MLRKLSACACAGTGCAVLAAAGLGAPVAWAARDRAPMEETCVEVGRGEPTGGARKDTAPPDGSTVSPGEQVDVTISWPVEAFAGPELHKVLDCVTVDGRPAPELSAEARLAPNDGDFHHTFTVPAGLPDGAQVCDRGFVSGVGTGGTFSREKTNDVCFTVEETPEAPTRRALRDEHPDAAPAPPVRQVVHGAVEEGPAAAPAPAPGPAAAPAARPEPLPRTGRSPRPFLVAAGAELFLGGLAVMAGARRRRRPPEGPSPGNESGADHAQATRP